MSREYWARFPRHRIQRKLLVSDPGMHHGTCVTHVPWCMSGSLTRGGGENVPGIPGACATRNFTYLVRGPWHSKIITWNPWRFNTCSLCVNIYQNKIWYGDFYCQKLGCMLCQYDPYYLIFSIQALWCYFVQLKCFVLNPQTHVCTCFNTMHGFFYQYILIENMT